MSPFQLLFAALPAPAQMLMMGEASEGFVSLFNGRDLGAWTGDSRWKGEEGVLSGASDGKTPSALTLGGREFGDFDLRFDVRIKRGAGGVLMRSEGAGPLGVQLEIGASVVRWLANGSPFLAVVNVKPNEWNAFRIVAKRERFEVFHADLKAPNTIVAGHLALRGKLSIVMPAGAVCEVEFRNIRIKE